MKELDMILNCNGDDDYLDALASDEQSRRLLVRKTIYAAVKPGGLFSVVSEKRDEGKKSYCPIDYFNAAQIETVKVAVYLAAAYSTISHLIG